MLAGRYGCLGMPSSRSGHRRAAPWERWRRGSRDGSGMSLYEAPRNQLRPGNGFAGWTVCDVGCRISKVRIAGKCNMRPTEEFPGFRPAADPQEQVDRAMALLGRRPDLAGRLRIKPDPARKLRTGGWSVFGFRGSRGGFNESPHLLLHVADKDVCARVILPNKARGGLWKGFGTGLTSNGNDLVHEGAGQTMHRCRRGQTDSRQSSPVFPLSRHGPARSSPTAGNADRAVLVELT